MNNRTYLLPGFKSWTFKTSDSGCGLHPPTSDTAFLVTADTPVLEISSYVENILWLKFRLQGDAAKTAAKAICSFDWQEMIREAGTDVQHQTPSLPDWTLKISDSGAGLWHNSGASIQITADTSMQVITDGVRQVLQDSLQPMEIEVQVAEIVRIDFRALILNAWRPKVAPLLAGFTADNSAFADAICADVRQLAILQADDSTEIANAICELVKKLA